MKRLSLIILTTGFMLSSCYLGKHIDENVNVFIESNYTASKGNSTGHTYIDNYSEFDYSKYMIENLISSLQICNVTVVDESNKDIDFVISLTSLDLEESTKTETVDDVNSEYNGRTYELATCEANADFSLYSNQSGSRSLIGSYSVFAEKEEKVKNSRTAVDYMFGSNKDNTEYRHKLLSDDVFKVLSEKCGNRISAKATKKMAKSFKKK
jgi:hypothetical protein